MTNEYIIDEDIANKICTVLVNCGENRLANKLCSRPAPSAPTYCLKCTSPGGICAEEDFCKGCDNFDAFFNSCKKTAYKQSFQNDEGKRTSGTVHPRTNASRWLLAVVGCASDTRKKVDSATTPHPTPAPCPQHQIWQHCPVAGEIARQAREDVLKIIEGCISAEGFLCVDQDDPVVLVPDLNRCIGAIRSTTPHTKQEQPR